LLDVVGKDLSRAQKDNDLIYHQEIPAAASLPLIKEVGMVQSVISEALTEPKTALGNDAVIFSELLGYGAKVAIGKLELFLMYLVTFIRCLRAILEIYQDRRRNWIEEEILARAQRLDDAASR
jgi:programmed cell death 6-interacting protein